MFQQNLLLKALNYTTDINELKKVAKFHSDAEVYRTLDKLSIRREYHEALARNGMGLDTLVNGIKDITLHSVKDDVKLKAYAILLKSIGLDKYEASENDGKNWEELLLKIAEKENATPTLKNQNAIDGKILYEVNVPQIPDDVQKKRAEDADMEKSIYE